MLSLEQFSLLSYNKQAEGIPADIPLLVQLREKENRRFKRITGHLRFDAAPNVLDLMDLWEEPYRKQAQQCAKQLGVDLVCYKYREDWYITNESLYRLNQKHGLLKLKQKYYNEYLEQVEYNFRLWRK